MRGTRLGVEGRWACRNSSMGGALAERASGKGRQMRPHTYLRMRDGCGEAAKRPAVARRNVTETDTKD